ncbi:recombinase family protein [Streptomyces sp. NPDC005760]|uniref:recombinase family protein n=1 Tax=Streptomyces sp. NPDC005760 TaxID=3156718 RepID=UPI0033E810BB
MNPTQDSGVFAREYRRLSDAKGGTSIARQGSDHSVVAAEQGWTLGEPYIDDGISASRFARKRRDDFEKLVADLSAGSTGRTSRFGADILMLWESSRGSRRVGEWVSFIELCEAKGVRIWVTTHERLYDPANGRDRKALIDDANDSEYESYKTHTRVLGTVAYEARQGRPHGRAPDGLMPVYDPRSGALETWVEDPARSGPVKELFELLERGHSLASIERRFADAGYRNRSGRPFSREHLRIMALRPAYAGLRTHNGTIHEGIWDPIVPVARFWNVRGILTAPSRKTTRGGRAEHELTAALWCGPCGDGLSVGHTQGKWGRKPVYRCEKGCVHIQKQLLDDFLIGTREESGAVIEYLARPDLHELLAAPDADEAEVRDVQARLARERPELEKMEQQTPSTFAAVEILGRALEAKRAEVKQLEQRERELTLPPAVTRWITPGQDVWDDWEAAPITARRELVRVVLSERGLGKLHILPAPSRGPNQRIVERLDFRGPSAAGAGA